MNSDIDREISDSESDQDPQPFGSPSKNSNLSEEERLQMALKQIQQLENELSDFQQSSYELEQELEKELNDLETRKQELEEALESKRKEAENWKAKYVRLESEFNNVTSRNEDKFKNYKKELQSVRSKLVNIEILNDNIEQNERILSINLNDLETKYNDSLERIALLESEINYKDEALLKEKLDNQNTQNQFNELKGEIDKLRSQQKQKLQREKSQSGQSSSSIFDSTGNASVSESVRNNIPKSNSIKQLHNMIEQTKFMENRVETIRNTIRPSKMRKVSGKTIRAEPVEHESDMSYDGGSEFNITGVSSIANSTGSMDQTASSYFTALSKSTTNDSLSHSKARNRKVRKSNLQKPPLQPLGSKPFSGTKEFQTHFTEKKTTPATTIKMVSSSVSSTKTSTTSNSTIKKISSTAHQLETIRGSPTTVRTRELKRVAAANNSKTSEVKKLFNSPSKTKNRLKGGLLPSLRKFNLSEK
ncbi:hypothetical protein DASC09_062800 [Saccharomycopsis crataegensis]|uniref:NUDE domain-containing protein n=1 Tax=Saccharomycopsis crataegensis TaxID=43959 RepID=A0AAV5QWP8_9ASCO|nr:hypothetical protein DASC09_062800 [Saccharomycopsis crataegensis]